MIPFLCKILDWNKTQQIWSLYPYPKDSAITEHLNFQVHEESTRPPDYLQESELIALMDKHGIGTDASIPQHIKNICDR